MVRQKTRLHQFLLDGCQLVLQRLDPIGLSSITALTFFLLGNFLPKNLAKLDYSCTGDKASLTSKFTPSR